jgi:hypothetical protein
MPKVFLLALLPKAQVQPVRVVKVGIMENSLKNAAVIQALRKQQIAVVMDALQRLLQALEVIQVVALLLVVVINLGHLQKVRLVDINLVHPQEVLLVALHHELLVLALQAHLLLALVHLQKVESREKVNKERFIFYQSQKHK